MMSVFWFILILLFVSFVVALISMQDAEGMEELRRLLKKRKIRGTILFLKDKVVHFHSSKSSLSSLK